MDLDHGLLTVMLWKWMPLDLELLDNNHGMLWTWFKLDVLLLDDNRSLLPPGLGWTQLQLPHALIAVLLDDGRQHCTTRTDELFGRPTQRSCRRLNAWWLAA